MRRKAFGHQAFADRTGIFAEAPIARLIGE